MWLSTSDYQQIAGRAGRTGVTNIARGECLLVVSKHDKLNDSASVAERRPGETQQDQVGPGGRDGEGETGGNCSP